MLCFVLSANFLHSCKSEEHLCPHLQPVLVQTSHIIYAVHHVKGKKHRQNNLKSSFPSQQKLSGQHAVLPSGEVLQVNTPAHHCCICHYSISWHDSGYKGPGTACKCSVVTCFARFRNLCRDKKGEARFLSFETVNDISSYISEH